MSEYSTRIEIFRSGLVVSSVLTNPDNVKPKDNNYQVSSKRSITSFPTLSITSTNSEINQAIMSFSKGDIIRLSVSQKNRDEFDLIFEGEFNKKTIKIEKKPDVLTINIDAIHSFYKLSMMELSSSFNFSELTFGKFVTDLTAMANIQSPIYIEPKLSNTIITGVSYKSNLYRLFKELCLILDATASFNEDNSVSIDYRTNKIESFRSREVQTITDNEIINMEANDSI